MNLFTELQAVCNCLARDGIEYAVCGGLAMAIHGFPRFTRDIDLLVRTEDLPAIFAKVAELGFAFPALPTTMRPGTPAEMHIYRVTKIEGSRHLPLDLIEVNTLLDSVWATRISHEHDERTIKVVSKAGLIAMKRLADRDQDKVDIKTLESNHE